jgi:hypothetical protein
MTTVIHIDRARCDDREVYIGRRNGGYFGNPVKLGLVCVVCGGRHSEAGDTLPCFRRYAEQRLIDDDHYRQQVKDLHDKILVCHCAPGPCHGNVLAELSAALNKE